MSDETTAAETVYVTATRSRKHPIYHTNDECTALSDDNHRSVALVALTDEFRECRRCAGGGDAAFGGPGEGHYKSLLEAARANMDAETKTAPEGGDA